MAEAYSTEEGESSREKWVGEVPSEQNALAARSGTEKSEAWLAWPERSGGKAVSSEQ
jgi:hypothetical protein